MSDDYDIDYDLTCPKCEHSPLHSRSCSNIVCDDGGIDESDEDYLLPGTSVVVCEECKGTGIEIWCPKCGANLSGHHFVEFDEMD